jgi:prepilin-type N-terminal cleavage/methylation domain-containing protein
MLMVSNRGGFTLIEVMITMAISGSMLMISVIMFGGQQRRTQFSQSLRDVSSVIDDAINDASTGYFPSSKLSCDSSSGTPAFTNNAVDKQGQSKGCVFLGKALHIKNTQVNIYPVIGNSDIRNTTFSSANPVLATQLVESKRYVWGPDVYEVLWGDTSSKNDSSRLLLFVSAPNGLGLNVDGTVASGTQKINSYVSGGAPVLGKTSSVDANTQESMLDAQINAATQYWPATGSVTLCFEDSAVGSNNRQTGAVVIAGGAGGMASHIQRDSETPRCP